MSDFTRNKDPIRKVKKLSLHRETLKNLNPEQQLRVAGGIGGTDRGCDPTYTAPCTWTDGSACCPPWSPRKCV